MRSVREIHRAEASPIGDLITYRALPVRTLGMLDPFLFLNHHGPQNFPSENDGLPFGPHPHRGIETVTFIIEGDIVHKDNKGYQNTIAAGGIQWMTAGKGLIHAETSSEAFKKNGGPLEILQLWLNLQARNKMIDPHYEGKQKDDIPKVLLDDGKVVVDIISGNWDGQEAAFSTVSNISIRLIHFKKDGKVRLFIPEAETIFFYVIRGSLRVNDSDVKMHDLVEFEDNDQEIDIFADSEAILLFGHGKPFNEPVVAKGPFVMNTEQEIAEAYRDFHIGKFGVWKE